MKGGRTDDGRRWLAVDLANSVGCPSCGGRDALSSRAEADRWIRRVAPGRWRPISAAELSSLREFRDDVRALLRAIAQRSAPPSTALRAVNRAASEVRSRPQLHWSGTEWSVEERGPYPRRARALLSESARSVIDIASGSDRRMLRPCSGPDCVHFLMAQRASQRWCSAQGCGNRARVRRHYRKVHPTRIPSLPTKAKSSPLSPATHARGGRPDHRSP